MTNENQGDEQSDDDYNVCSKPKGPNGDDQGKSKNINELTGIPELEIDTEGDNEDDIGEKEKEAPKQSTDGINRGIDNTCKKDDVIENFDELLQIQHEDVAEEVEYWNQAIVCFILGANPPWEVIEGFIRRVWTRYNIDKISFLPHGIFLVRFKTMEMKEKVLQSGHYLFYNKPLIVKEWSKDLEMTKAEVQAVPTWIQFHRLPLKFWGKSLPKIAGLIGKYIKCDNPTEQRIKLGYARVMVEVAVDGNLPEIVTFKDEKDDIVQVEVEYEWKPVTCGKCHKMGHHIDQCRKGQPPKTRVKTIQKVWRPVVKQVVKPVEDTRQTEGPELETNKSP
ncbi:hypothetical protein vseg_013352 [Gypsophila vaccaria]